MEIPLQGGTDKNQSDERALNRHSPKPTLANKGHNNQ